MPSSILNPPSSAPPGHRLSPAQRRVLALLVQGWQRKEIAAEMRLSVAGVDYHCGVIFRELGVTTNVDAVRVALAAGLG